MNLNFQKIANPYALFGIAWTLSLLLYVLGWSDLFPKVSSSLIFFLSFFILFFLLTSVVYNRINTSIITTSISNIGHKKLLFINFFIFSLNFLYSGIPVLSGTKDPDFGIPTIIVLATTLNSFCAVYSFYLFLIRKNFIYILYVFLCLLLFVCDFSRGYIMMNLLTMFFLWLNVKQPDLTFKKIVSILSGLLLVLYLFGVAGNYRTLNEIRSRYPDFDVTYNNDLILKIGDASDSFRTNVIPGEFFWTYLYITSPLSNLQYNITLHSPPVTVKSIFYLIIDEAFFDTVSKRLDGFLNRQRIFPDLIVSELTVSTTLANSYDYAGWIGMGVFLLIFWTVPLIYAFMVRNNPLGIIGKSTLCTIYFLSIFDNMLTLTGLSFQLLFPLLVFWLSKVRLINN